MTQVVSPTRPSSPQFGDTWKHTLSGLTFEWQRTASGPGAWVQILVPGDPPRPVAQAPTITNPTPKSTTSPLAPTAATPGDFWFHSETGVEFVYYDDGDTRQWVTCQPTKVGDIIVVTGPAGGDLSGSYPNPTIREDVELVRPTTSIEPAPDAHSLELAPTSWVNDAIMVAMLGDVEWDNIQNKPATFPPEAHTQDWSTITGKPSTFPPTLPIAQSGVTNLTTDLAGKVSKSGDTMTGDLRLQRSGDLTKGALFFGDTSTYIYWDGSIFDFSSQRIKIADPTGPTDSATKQYVDTHHPTTLPPNGPAGGALNGTYPNPGLVGGPLSNYALSSSIPTTLPPNGPAGGDLQGTYPNPTLKSSVLAPYLPLAGGTMTGTLGWNKGSALTADTPAVDITQTWNNGATVFHGFRMNITATAQNANSRVYEILVDGHNVFAIDHFGSALLWGSFYGGGKITAHSGNPLPAQGDVNYGVFFGSPNIGILPGTGVPNKAAPKGSIYLRNDGTGAPYYNADGTAAGWVQIGTGGGSTVFIGTSAPTVPAPTAGNLWFNSELGQMFIYYDDGNTSQWVPTTPVPQLNYTGITRLYSETLVNSPTNALLVGFPAGAKQVELVWDVIVTPTSDPTLTIQGTRAGVAETGAGYILNRMISNAASAGATSVGGDLTFTGTSFAMAGGFSYRGRAILTSPTKGFGTVQWAIVSTSGNRGNGTGSLETSAFTGFDGYRLGCSINNFAAGSYLRAFVVM